MPHKRTEACTHNNNWKILNFSFFDKYSFIKDYFPGTDDELLFGCTRLNKENKLWKYAYKKFGDELNGITLLQTIQKLKASVEVLIEKACENENQDPELKEEISAFSTIQIKK